MLQKIVKNQNFWIIIAIVAIVVGVFSYVDNSEFGGADGQAEEYIVEANPAYEPWFSNIWEPPGSEIESLLFALQAAIGAGILFYVIGYYKGKKAIVK
ncbi:energy-coupling factor ABC transporter substrate-binding protein [Marinifilum sp. N1E240]|uniref:energy-coupling factor ABC transporter substrate-binding protein n=1 Tax=Marinifilum sp. N1E240 TaxID=2608082 RepID=UPI00128B8EEF|nr:energy-coupling factor ABC transporter substrate-binding protein [Marinifilum sp. N1E240]MPQ49055.1 energy-coupling factor ABC transporter substrate-binding protein [Marinifilum sp. N1E240]